MVNSVFCQSSNDFWFYRCYYRVSAIGCFSELSAVYDKSIIIVG